MVTVLAGQEIPRGITRVRDDQGRSWTLAVDGMWHDTATGRHHQTGAELAARTDLVEAPELETAV